MQSVILRKKMDGRSWPWKKKSSDKATTEKQVVGNESTNVSSLSYLASLENQVSLFVLDQTRALFFLLFTKQWL